MVWLKLGGIIVFAVIAVAIISAIILVIKEHQESREISGGMFSKKSEKIHEENESQKRNARENARKYFTSTIVEQYADRYACDFFTTIIDAREHSTDGILKLENEKIYVTIEDRKYSSNVNVCLDNLDEVRSKEDVFAFFSAISQVAYHKVCDMLFDISDEDFELTICDSIEERTISGKVVSVFSVYFRYSAVI